MLFTDLKSQEADIFKQCKTLIIDDEEAVCEFLADHLKKEGFQVDYFCRPDEVLERLKEKLNYSVLLIDLKLKDINGLELIKKIKEVNPEIIFIIITGYPDLSSAISAIKEEVFNFIIKPFSLEEVKISVRNAFEKYCLRKQNKMLLKSLMLANRNLTKAQKKLEDVNVELNDEVVDKEQKLVETRQALEDRKTVEIAKGILMKKLNLSEDEAMETLQKESRKARCKLVKMAKAIINWKKIN